MTPKARMRQKATLGYYKAEVLEGVASWVEQLEVAEGLTAIEMRDKIVYHIRKAKGI